MWNKSSIGKPIGDVPYSAYASAKEVDQGAAGHGRSLKDLIDAIGSDSATITFLPGVYTFSTNEIVPSNISLIIQQGALFSVDSGKTLTIAHGDSIIAGTGYQIFSGAGAVDFTVGRSSPVTPKWWGATGDGSTDDTTALTEAFKHSKVLIPAGTYMVNADQVLTTNSGVATLHTSFIMHSLMDIEGVGNVRIKIKDNISSGAAPISIAMFACIEDILNLRFNNIIFDMNGTNNKIALPPFTPPFGLRPQSAFFWAPHPSIKKGTVDGLLIENCTFTDCAGDNQIILGLVNGGLSNNVVIRNCKFTENGHNTSDHTSIFSWAENVLIEGCTFTRAASQDYGFTGTAIEIHGKNTTCRHNIIDDMQGGIAVVDNTDNVSSNIHVYGNYMNVREGGILFFTRSSGSMLIRDVFVTKNVIDINEGATLNNVKVGISIVTGESMNNIYIEDNTIRHVYATTPTFNVYGFDQACNTAGQKHDNIFIRRNTVTGTTYGYNSGSAVVGLGNYGNIFIEDNYFDDLVSGGATIRGLLYITATGITTDFLKITGNTLYNIKIQSVNITDLYIDGSNILNPAGSQHTEQAPVTITNRLGSNHRAITHVLTAAEVNALKASPMQLVVAPGENSILEFESAILYYKYATAPFTVEDMVIRYDAGDSVTASINTTGFLDQSVNGSRWILPAWTATADLFGSQNKKLELFNIGVGEMSGGGTSTLTVTINYKIHKGF